MYLCAILAHRLGGSNKILQFRSTGSDTSSSCTLLLCLLFLNTYSSAQTQSVLTFGFWGGVQLVDCFSDFWLCIIYCFFSWTPRYLISCTFNFQGEMSCCLYLSRKVRYTVFVVLVWYKVRCSDRCLFLNLLSSYLAENIASIMISHINVHWPSWQMLLS